MWCGSWCSAGMRAASGPPDLLHRRRDTQLACPRLRRARRPPQRGRRAERLPGGLVQECFTVVQLWNTPSPRSVTCASTMPPAGRGVRPPMVQHSTECWTIAARRGRRRHAARVSQTAAGAPPAATGAACRAVARRPRAGVFHSCSTVEHPFSSQRDMREHNAPRGPWRPPADGPTFYRMLDHRGTARASSARGSRLAAESWPAPLEFSAAPRAALQWVPPGSRAARREQRRREVERFARKG